MVFKYPFTLQTAVICSLLLICSCREGDTVKDDKVFEAKRLEMVINQIESRDISDSAVLDAMKTVPRHLFVPSEFRHRAYDDTPLAIGENQTISQPYIVAFMTEALQLNKESRVLEIGRNEKMSRNGLHCI